MAALRAGGPTRSPSKTSEIATGIEHALPAVVVPLYQSAGSTNSTGISSFRITSSATLPKTALSNPERP